MRDRIPFQLDRFEVSASAFTPLANRFRNFVRLAVSNADIASTIADNNEGGEAESTSAFDYLRAAIDEDDLLVNAVIRLLFFTTSTIVAPMGTSITRAPVSGARSRIARRRCRRGSRCRRGCCRSFLALSRAWCLIGFCAHRAIRILGRPRERLLQRFSHNRGTSGHSGRTPLY